MHFPVVFLQHDDFGSEQQFDSCDIRLFPSFLLSAVEFKFDDPFTIFCVEMVQTVLLLHNCK
jgi:hypothetical protein